MRQAIAPHREERWHTLEPFIPEEAMRSAQAAARAGVTQRTMLNWAEERGLGRLIGKRWRISRVALEMFLEGNEVALALYLSGERKDHRVAEYFQRLGVSLRGRLLRAGK